MLLWRDYVHLLYRWMQLLVSRYELHKLLLELSLIPHPAEMLAEPNLDNSSLRKVTVHQVTNPTVLQDHGLRHHVLCLPIPHLIAMHVVV